MFNAPRVRILQDSVINQKKKESKIHRFLKKRTLLVALFFKGMAFPISTDLMDFMQVCLFYPKPVKNVHGSLLYVSRTFHKTLVLFTVII